MRSIILSALFFLCSGQALAQDQNVSVKFTESKRHIVITIKTPDPISPGIQGKFRVQFRRGENSVVYNDTTLKGGRVRQVAFDTPKQLEMIKVIFFIPGENGYQPFGLGFRRNFVQTPKPNQMPENPSRLVFITQADGTDGDGFPASATLLEDSRNWDLLLDADDEHEEINPMAPFAYQPLEILKDNALELVMDINGDGELELEFSDELGVYDPLNTKTGSRVGWLGRVPEAYEFGERVMVIGGDFVLASVIRGAR